MPHSSFRIIFSACHLAFYARVDLNFTTILPFSLRSEIAAEWRVKRPFRAQARRARDFAFNRAGSRR